MHLGAMLQHKGLRVDLGLPQLNKVTSEKHIQFKSLIRTFVTIFYKVTIS